MRCAGAGVELGWTQDMVTTRSVVPSPAERGEGGGGPSAASVGCRALLPLQDEQSQMCRNCDTASSLHPPCARALHRTWSHPAAARWPSEAGWWWRGRHHAGADGTWRHCCRDAGHSVRSLGGDVERRNLRCVCESVDTRETL